MNELVSIVMPSYNTAKYIGASIRSVLAQSYSNWELIIVDDCSTDDTDNVVKQYLTDNRIRFLKNEKNSGAAVSRNRALREAKGKWIAFLDSDDLWKPDKLEKQITFMECKNCDFSYTQYYEIDEDSKQIGRIVDGPKIITKLKMYQYCWPGCLTVMYNAERIGVIQIADLKKNNDYAIWLKAIKKADCYLLAEQLAMYRRRSGSISNRSHIELLKWHYRLFRFGEKYSVLKSLFYTVSNLIWGIIKKVKYVKTVN